MLLPFGKEGHSPDKNAGFPDTTKLHAEEEGCSANENVGFPDTTKTTLLNHDTMLTKHYLFINSTIQECQYWKLRFSYTNEVYSLKMYCSCTHWHLGFHLLKTHDINKEGNCKFMEMQSWQYCPSCAFVENFFSIFEDILLSGQWYPVWASGDIYPGFQSRGLHA